MSEERLVEAMRLGTQSPLDEREKHDLGRFGLGLKTASFSQCKKLTVSTKEASGRAATRFWDLDHVSDSKEWQLGKVPSGDTRTLLQPLEQLPTGTIVLWQKLDRLVIRSDNWNSCTQNPEDAFYKTFMQVKCYLEMVFHQFLEARRDKINIHVGTAECKPWDPYLRTNAFTQELASEKYEDSRVSIIPYILPHVSKRSEEEGIRGAGPKGWNAQQGFYLYRNGRMIISGGYLDLDLKAEEHCKLARIKVEITNDMDHEWSIDVRKAAAIPPVYLRNDLLRIARAARQKAVEVYRSRTGRARRQPGNRAENDVWLRQLAGDKITYRINRDNLVIKKIIQEINPSKRWLKKLFHVIETTVPHRLIIMDDREREDCHVGLPEDVNKPPDELLRLCIELYHEQRAAGRRHEEAADIICSMDAFSVHPLYRACLDGLQERMR